MRRKYYTVVHGHQPGVYTDWPTAEKQVKGFPGAIFKSFSTLNEANLFLKNSTRISSTPQTKEPYPTKALTNASVVYTDGSCKDQRAGFGVVILAKDGDKLTARGPVPLKATNQVAELYAIYVALSLVGGDVVVCTDSNYSIACLTSYIHTWLNTEWKGVANREIIEATFNKMRGRQVSFIHVPGHSGVPLNEEADDLANRGRDSNQQMIIERNGVPVIHSCGA